MNETRKHISIFILALGLLALGLSATANASLMDKLQWKMEKHFGNATVAEMEYTYGFIKEPYLEKYINALGDSLAKESHRTDIDYHFYIVDTDEVNAFAAPGGFVFVTRGLMETMDSEEELASVVGHEIGHVAAKHGAKQVKKMPLVIVGSLALANNANETTQRIVGTVFSLMQLHYSREDEYQADTLGVEYAYDAGYDPDGMISFFKKLEEEHPTGKLGRMDVAFSSHPKTPSRISKAAATEQMNEDAEKLMYIADSYAGRYYLHEAVEKYKEVLEIDPQNAGAAEKIGDSLLMLGKNDEAAEWFAIAKSLDPSFIPEHGTGVAINDEKRDEPISLASAAFIDRDEARMTASTLGGKAGAAEGIPSRFSDDFEDLDSAALDIESSLKKNWKAYSSLSKAFNPNVDPRAEIISRAIGNIETSFALTENFQNLEETLNAISSEHARTAREAAWRLENSRNTGPEALAAAKDLSDVLDRLPATERFAVRNYSNAASSAKQAYFSSHRAVAEVSRTLDETEMANISYLTYGLGDDLEDEEENLDDAIELAIEAEKNLDMQRLSLKRALLNFNGALLSPAEKNVFGKMLERRFGMDEATIKSLRDEEMGYGDILLLASSAKKEKRSVSETIENMKLLKKNATQYFAGEEKDSTGGILLLRLAEADMSALTNRRPMFDLEPEPTLAAVDLIGEAATNDASLAEAAGFIDAGDFDSAINALNARGKSLPATAESHLLLAMALLEKDDVEGAIENFKYSLKKNGKNVDAHVLLADAFTTMKRYEDARNEYAEAAKYGPDDPRVTASAAYSAALEGELDEALEGYNKAAENAEYAHPDLFINIGLLYYREGFMKQAIESFEAALRLAPEKEKLAEMITALSSS